MRNSTATLDTETTLIPDADAPTDDDASEPVETATTFDLGVLAPSTADAPKSTTTSMPKATTTTAGQNFAIVHVNNTTANTVKVWLGDASEHAAVVLAGEGVNWFVKTSTSDPDRGGATLNGTNCGAKWADANNVVGGREYHFEVTPSVGFCANGQVMPQLVITDYTAGTSKTLGGLMPDANHALIYTVNKSVESVFIGIDDDGTAIEWTLSPGTWGSPDLISTGQGDNDTVTARRVEGECAWSPGIGFVGGHTYRVEVADGGSCDSVPLENQGTTLRLVIYDLTTNDFVSFG